MNCQHCGKKLPLLRKFKGGEFCSEEHRAAYSRESDRLALRRLIETPATPLRSVTPRPSSKSFQETLQYSRPQDPPLYAVVLPLTAAFSSQPGARALAGTVPDLLPMGRELALGYFRGAKPRARLWLPVSSRTASQSPAARTLVADQAAMEEALPSFQLLLSQPASGADIDPINWQAWSETLAEEARRAEAGPPVAGLMELHAALAQFAAAPMPAERVSAVMQAPAAMNDGENPRVAVAAMPRLQLRTSSAVAEMPAPPVEPSRQLRVRPTAPRPEAPPLAGLTRQTPIASLAGSREGKLGLTELPTVLAPRPAWPAWLGLRATEQKMPVAGEVPMVAFGQSGGVFHLRLPNLGDPMVTPRPAKPALARPSVHLPWGGDVDIPLPAAVGASVFCYADAPEPESSVPFLEPPGSVPLVAPSFDPPLSSLRAPGVTARNPVNTRRLASCDEIEAVGYEPGLQQLPAMRGLEPVEPAIAPLARRQPGTISGLARPLVENGVAAEPLELHPVDASLPATSGIHCFEVGVGTAVRLFALPHDRLLARDCSRRPVDQLTPCEPKGFIILSSSRMKLRTGDEASALGRFRMALPKLPGLGSLPKWSAGLVMALVAGVVLFTATPKASGNIAPSEPSAWSNIQRTISKRAAVALTDDFRSGLGDWTGKEGWGMTWSFDPTGFARTGSLALYSPSVGLSDYRFEFLGQIEKKALTWVVRAADLENYQVVRLELTSGGPLPRAYVVRYPVLNGKKGHETRTDLPMAVTADTVYRVAMEIHGADHTLMVQGQVVDSWTEDRLMRGGVGFFSAAGERARLRWIGIWHQYDALGRLCAYLAPRQTEGMQ